MTHLATLLTLTALLLAPPAIAGEAECLPKLEHPTTPEPGPDACFIETRAAGGDRISVLRRTAHTAGERTTVIETLQGPKGEIERHTVTITGPHGVEFGVQAHPTLGVSDILPRTYGQAAYTTEQRIFDADGRVTDEVSAHGARTHRIIRTRRTGERTREVSYDPSHAPVVQRLDAQGRPVSSLDAEGNGHRYTYAADGRVTTDRLRGGAVTGRIVMLRQGPGDDAPVLSEQRFEPRGDTLVLVFDESWKRHPDGRPISMRRVETIHGHERITDKTFDARGREVSAQQKTEDEDCRVFEKRTAWHADTDQTTLEETACDGVVRHRTVTAFDTDGRPTKRTHDHNIRADGKPHTGTVETWTYDACGALLERVVRRDGRITSSTAFTRDARGRALSMTVGAGEGAYTRTWTYDAAGRVATSDDARFEYDAQGRLIAARGLNERDQLIRYRCD